MPNHDQIAELFERHVANPSDPYPTIELINHSELTAKFFQELVGSGDVVNFSIGCKVQLIAMLGVWCTHKAKEILEMWAIVESDSEVTQILKKQVFILSEERKIGRPARD